MNNNTTTTENEDVLLDLELSHDIPLDEVSKPIQTHEQLFPQFQNLTVDHDDVNEQLIIKKNNNIIGNNNNKNNNDNINDTSISGNNDNQNANLLSSNENYKNAKCWQLQYYQPYFDIDTYNLLLRLRSPFLILGKKKIFDIESNEKSDLYGPFWITITLAFLMAAMGNFSRFINQSNINSWNSDIAKISEAATFLFTSLILVPTIIYFILRSFDIKQGIIELVAIYGYSLFPFIPACMLCVAPWDVFDWCVVAVSMAISMIFLIKNIYVPIPTDKKRKPGLYILAIIFVVEVGISLVFKVYFFKY